MLSLPADWPRIMPCYSVLRTLRQVKNRRLSVEVTRHLIRAAFDLGFMTRWSKSELRIEESPRFTWHIGDYEYICLPVIDDRVLSKCAKKRRGQNVRQFLVPASQRFLFKNAVHDALGDRSPIILTVDDFIALRMLFSSMDANWSHYEVLHAMIGSYNDRATEGGLDQSLMIEMPGKPEEANAQP